MLGRKSAIRATRRTVGTSAMDGAGATDAGAAELVGGELADGVAA